MMQNGTLENNPCPDSLTAKRSKPTVLLVHLSDLFYGSGTAVIYRRLIELLGDHAAVHQYVGSWRSSNQDSLAEQYRKQTTIHPHFARHLPLRNLYGRISRRWNRNIPDMRIPGWMDGIAIQKLIRTIQADIVWWSGDYLPVSLTALQSIPRAVFENRRLLFSLYDPPGFWNCGRWSLNRAFQGALSRADGLDVIGENMATLVRREGFLGDPVILNDYANGIPLRLPVESDRFRVAITGQIYGGELLERFVQSLASSKSEVEIHWFGTEQNLSSGKQIQWPANVRCIPCGIVPRQEIPGIISQYDAGYLNMPSEPEGFAEYSVPTKLVTYLEAGLPVLFHAPHGAEVDILNEAYGFGINLNRDPSLTSIRNNRPGFQAGGSMLVQTRFEKQIVQDKLFQYLKIHQ